MARLANKRVEVIGERTVSSTTWVLADGTMSTGNAAGPIWVRKGGDGTAAADWSPVDLTLEKTSDGSVRPKAHPSGLVLAGAGAAPRGQLLSMTGPDGQAVGVAWDKPLPAPRLEGPRAVYSNVQPGVDLVVEATRTGFEQYYVLTGRPAAGAAQKLGLQLRSDKLKAASDADGGVSFTDQAGRVVGTTGTPLVWDAAVDGERLHPIGKPWTAAGEQADRALAPQPKYDRPSLPKSPPSGPPKAGRTLSTTPATPPLPAAAAAAGDVVPSGAGRASSAAAAKAQGSPALPVAESAAIVGPGDVDLALSAEEAFLQDPATQYPVVVDPAYNFAWGFDTFVQTGISTDQSGSTELRLGTYDGGATVARSFVNFDLSTIRSRTIFNAQLSLWEWHSYSCQARNWEVWNTDPAGTGTRINAQPNWYGRWSTSSATTGYGAGCDDGWVSADVTSLIQAWSNGGATTVGVGLKAENETDTYGWKKFNAANAYSGVPTLYVNWSEPPGQPTGLTTSPSATVGGAVWATSATPRLSATAHDADGSCYLLFRVVKNTGEFVWEKDVADVPDGTAASVDVPAGLLAEQGAYTFAVYPHDYVQWGSVNSGWAPVFTVGSLKPAAPTVSSTDYPNDNTWHLAENTPGNVVLALSESDPTFDRFEWGLDKAPEVKQTATGTSATISVTPPTNGRHELQVQSVDKAGNRSPVVKYRFNVGRAGLLSPLEGSQVVRRVRLTAGGEAAFTHVKFEWRRGPDAATTKQDIALAALSQADGRTLSSTWTKLSDLGDYATWDAGLTLGHIPGPIQVAAVMAQDGQGTGAYETPWVTVTVSPDAKNAATDSVGPGSVNLLTGDYTLSSTDVDEFGMSLARTASSRDPRAGFEPQADRLTTAQQTMSDISGWNAGNARLTRVTDRWHTGSDALQVEATGASPASYAYAGPASTGDIGMTPGKTYRVSGWIYVPAATGLSPDYSEGLRIATFYRDAVGGYPTAVTPLPTLTDTWQYVTTDISIPTNATSNGGVRVFNGFTANGKKVYFDDVSVREIWAPLGPQWSLGTADQATGTEYTHISQDAPDVATVHTTGGGEIWFTASGTGKWWPEPGAEGLTLAPTGTGTWRLTELDGTVSDFAQQGGVDAKLVAASPPAAAGTTRLVYTSVAGTLRLKRLIAAVEPGVDPAAQAGTACTEDPTLGPLPVGCEVMELVYATATYGDRLALVRLWSTASPTATQAGAVVAAQYSYDSTGRLQSVSDPRISRALPTTYQYDADGRVVTMTPPGELPWSFRYGSGGSRSTIGAGDLVDRSSGRLLSVSRASLVPGSNDQTGPDTTSTVVYAVPLKRADGGPHDLDPDAIATWAQRTGPTDATAIFGPEDVPTVTTADATTPGKDGYKPATIHYLDSSGREVNTATPAGPDAPAGGFIDTAEYDAYGNVTRSLDATGRLLALGQLPTATTDLAALNLTTADTATRALALSTLKTYGADGLELQRQRGPLLRLAIGNDPNNIQLVNDLTTYRYDENRPDGTAYHLVTTTTDALLLAGSAPEQLLDVGVTTTGYAPIDGASTLDASSGWVVRQPTVTTVDAGAGGANLTAQVRYSAQGKVVESRKAGSTGTDAGTTRTIYYSAAANSDDAGCGNRPDYAGLPCVTKAAGTVTGQDSTRMAAELPVKRVTGYNRYGSITSVTETATGPIGGATVTQSRTTTTAYDDADRVTSVTISGTGTGTAAVPLGRTVSTYDPASGDVTRVESRDPATDAVVSATGKTFDKLGRMTRYDDGNGGVTTSVFDQYGKPTTVSDSLGATTSFTYDRTSEPRGFATSATDSVGGTLSATYGPDGQLLTQSMPGGVKLSIGYDSNRNPITRTYSRTSDNQVIASSAVVENGSGQWITHTTAASTKTYSYDRIGRLTDVADTTIGAGLCTARRYGFNDRAGRTSMTTAVSGTSTCADPGNPGSAALSTTGYTYDSADRLVSDTATGAGAWIYDPLGRITTGPVRGSPGSVVTNAFYANDLVASQTIAGVARQSWTLDPLQRFSSYKKRRGPSVATDSPAGSRQSPRSTTTTPTTTPRRGSPRTPHCRTR